jgi:predicted acetyltransferase
MAEAIADVFLREPKAEDEAAFQAFFESFRRSDKVLNYPGFSNFSHYPDYASWLLDQKRFAQGKNLPQGFVPAITFLLIRKEDDRIIGIINIRLALNKRLLTWGGHMGFSIIPEERNKGYGTKLLKLALKACHRRHLYKVLVSCDDENAICCHVIEKCGGTYTGLYRVDERKVTVRRYWIKND